MTMEPPWRRRAGRACGDAEEGALEVDIHSLVVFVGRDVGDGRPDAVDAGVGEKDVEAAVALRELVYGGAKSGGVTDVGTEGNGAGTDGVDLGSCLVKDVRRDVEQADAGAFLREFERCRATDAGCGAGDERDLVLQQHGVTLFRNA